MRGDDETQVFPRQRGPHGAPWQGPPPPVARPRQTYDRSQITMAAIAAAAVILLCGILAWFLADVIPG